MTKEKKTALDLMAKQLSKLWWTTLWNTNCPLYSNYCKTCSKVNNNCENKIKQYFQEKADIPDGWDVIKKRIAFHKKALWDNPSPEYNEGIILELENLCEWNGIEVDDE